MLQRSFRKCKKTFGKSPAYGRENKEAILKYTSLAFTAISCIINIKGEQGSLTFTADVKNNTYTEGKAVNIITVIYNGNTLYGAYVTPITIAKDETYPLNVTMDIPTSGLTESWKTAIYVWDNDMITPLVK